MRQKLESAIHAKIEQLSIRYGRQPAICDVSIEIPRHQITTFIGPSGCGKSSVLLTLNRMSDLISNCSVTGKILIDDQDILADDMDLISLRKNVGLIFQKPNPFPVSIRKNIELPLKEHGIGDRIIMQEKTEAVLKQTGLWNEVKDRLNFPALSLSGGQQQRLCMARALALEPKILLMDEPCSSLDPISSGLIEDLVSELKSSTTIVLVSHDIGQAKRIADQVGVFWYESGSGRLVEVCQDRKAFEESTHPITRCFLDGTRC